MPAQHPYQILDALGIASGHNPDLDGFVQGRLGLTIPELRACVVTRFGDGSPEVSAIDTAMRDYCADDWETIPGATGQATRVHRTVVELRKAVAGKFGPASRELAAFESLVETHRRNIPALTVAVGNM